MVKKKKLLFVCTANINRSPTFEKWFAENVPEVEVKSAGTHYGYPCILDNYLMNWADIIYVMDLSHAVWIHNRFNDNYHKVKVIGISDQYDPDEPALIELIKFWWDKTKTTSRPKPRKVKFNFALLKGGGK